VHKRNFALTALVVAAILATTSSLHAQITGFGGAAQTGWTSNNSGGPAASVTGTGTLADVLSITAAQNSNNNSYFFNSPQPLTTGGWTASFTYQLTAGTTPPADGIALVLQNDPRGASALGVGGGGLGYSGGFSTTPVNGTNGIIKSESMQFNVFSSAGGGVGIGQYPDAGGASSGGTYTLVAPVGLSSVNNPVNVSMTFDGVSTLTETLTEQNNTQNTVTKTFSMPSIQQVLGGGNTYLVGFTGATGGLNAAQQISGFTFVPVGSQVNPSLNIFKAGDTIAGVNAVPGAGTAANSPAAESAPNSIDSNQPSKYLNFNKPSAGIVVTPSVGRTIANELGLISANDSPERDPASYEVWGTNDNNLNDISPALNPTNWQNFWTLISTGSVPAFSLRGQEQDFFFNNNTSYSSYLVDFPTLANSGTANSMQIADIQLSGRVPEPATLALAALGAVGLILIRRWR
jgi:hypothetical protein